MYNKHFFLHILNSIYLFIYFRAGVYDSHPSECGVTAHGGSDLYFPKDTDIDCLYVYLSNLHSYTCPLLILNGVFVFYC